MMQCSYKSKRERVGEGNYCNTYVAITCFLVAFFPSSSLQAVAAVVGIWPDDTYVCCVYYTAYQRCANLICACNIYWLHPAIATIKQHRQTERAAKARNTL